jgi:hypothetical protein
MKVSCKSPGDAFEMTRGILAAVVLAGYALPVAPFDLEAHILAKPSNDIDTVQALFSADKGAYVGYSTCDAPFYLLLTDCVRSLRQLVPVHPRLSEVKQLFAHWPDAAIGFRANLHARNGRYRSPTRRYYFDCRAARPVSGRWVNYAVCRVRSGGRTLRRS